MPEESGLAEVYGAGDAATVFADWILSAHGTGVSTVPVMLVELHHIGRHLTSPFDLGYDHFTLREGVTEAGLAETCCFPLLR